MQTTLVTSDVFDFLRSTPSQSIDCVITDPPYEALDKHRAKGTTTRLDRWFPSMPDSVWPRVFDEWHRVLKPNTHLYVFCDPSTMPTFVEAGTRNGFNFWKPIIWDKEAIGMGYHYRCQYEMILFFEKGKRKLNNLGISDVIRCKRIHPSRSVWPTEKPIDVARILIEQSTQRGETVLDPFCGSGFVSSAAVDTGRGFCCADMNDDAIKIARERALKRLESSGAFPPASEKCCGGTDHNKSMHVNDCPLLSR